MESEKLNSFKLTNMSFFEVMAIALENNISSHKMARGGGKSHLQIMSDIWRNKSHFWNLGDLVCQTSLSSGYTDSTCKVKWHNDTRDCDASAAGSFWASLSSILESNCINTEKVLMWNCGGAEMKNYYWNFSSLLPYHERGYQGSEEQKSGRMAHIF